MFSVARAAQDMGSTLELSWHVLLGLIIVVGREEREERERGEGGREERGNNVTINYSVT